MFMKNKHESMRGYFAYELYQHMKKNKDIWLIVGDLGYKVFDNHFKDFPERCINTGAAEVAMMDIGVGLALEGKIPFVYSITPFLIYRPFEVIRTYINHEKINVKLIGSGRDKDYEHDGFSHDATDVWKLFQIVGNIGETFDLPIFDNIKDHWPENKEEIKNIVDKMCKTNRPEFLSLCR